MQFKSPENLLRGSCGTFLLSTCRFFLTSICFYKHGSSLLKQRRIFWAASSACEQTKPYRSLLSYIRAGNRIGSWKRSFLPGVFYSFPSPPPTRTFSKIFLNIERRLTSHTMRTSQSEIALGWAIYIKTIIRFWNPGQQFQTAKRNHFHLLPFPPPHPVYKVCIFPVKTALTNKALHLRCVPPLLQRKFLDSI